MVKCICSEPLVSRIEELRGTPELQGRPAEVSNTAFNDQTDSLFTLDSTTQELIATWVEPDERSSPSARFNLSMGIQQAKDMDFDPISGRGSLRRIRLEIIALTQLYAISGCNA
jgi:hypothetical protein